MSCLTMEIVSNFFRSLLSNYIIEAYCLGGRENDFIFEEVALHQTGE